MTPVAVSYTHLDVYKRQKPHRADEVQVCAQALCLEEMFGLEIPSGFLFYGETQKRMEVVFEDVYKRQD